MGFLLKTTEETYVYEEDAAVVAQTCIDVLGRLGKVTKVERDSGIILGKIKPKVFERNALVALSIKREGDNTKLVVKFEFEHAYITRNKHYDKMMFLKFMKGIEEDGRLSGKSSGGW